MVDDRGNTGSVLSALLATPLEVVRRIKDDNILLVGMGIAAVLAIIAIFGPSGAQIYAWIIAGFALALVLVRAVLELRKQNVDATSSAGNTITAKKSLVKKNKMRAGGGSNVITAKGSEIVGNEMTTGSQAAPAED